MLVAPGARRRLDWRLILGIGAIPAIVAVALRSRMPESPRWLMRQAATPTPAKAFGQLGMEISEEEVRQLRSSCERPEERAAAARRSGHRA